MGHAARYVDSCYAGMRDDVARTTAYRNAIIAAVTPEDIVLDIGTGALALLAIFAAEAGAEHVYAFEVNMEAAIAARAAVAKAGFADRITILDGFSTSRDVTIPRKATIVIHELIGDVGGEEGVVAAIVDARARHMRMDSSASAPARSIPARTRTLIAPCEYPDVDYCRHVAAPLLEGPGQSKALKLQNVPDRTRLAPPETFEDLRFEKLRPEVLQRVELTFVAARPGVWRGLLLHVELFVGVDSGDDVAPEVSSAWSGSHWSQVLLLFDTGVVIQEGQSMRVRARAELAGPQPRYEFEAATLEETRLNSGDGACASSGGTTSPSRMWKILGTLHYPEAALNVNDMADVIMDQFAP